MLEYVVATRQLVVANGEQSSPDSLTSDLDINKLDHLIFNTIAPRLSHNFQIFCLLLLWLALPPAHVRRPVLTVATIRYCCRWCRPQIQILPCATTLVLYLSFKVIDFTAVEREQNGRTIVTTGAESLNRSWSPRLLPSPFQWKIENLSFYPKPSVSNFVATASVIVIL